MKTIGRRIYRIRALDGFSSQASSSVVILGASFLGAPVSTSHVVASSIVGIGAGRRRWHHVRWRIVREHRHRLADDDSRDGCDRRRRLPDLEVGGMTTKPHWFLPDTPDVLGMLRQQLAVTIRGMDALVEWAQGDDSAAGRVRELEHEADGCKRELQLALVRAFTTPYDAEDIYTLGRGIDWILNLSKDAVRESEVMSCPPDASVAEMAVLLREGVGHIDDAVAALQERRDDATTSADAAMKTERHDRARSTARRWPTCSRSTTCAR